MLEKERGLLAQRVDQKISGARVVLGDVDPDVL
jgi:hypothetical protein